MQSSQQTSAAIGVIHDFIERERQDNFAFLGNYSHHYMRQEDLLDVKLANTQKPQALHAATVPNFSNDIEVLLTFTEVCGATPRPKTVLIKTLHEQNLEMKHLLAHDPHDPQFETDWIPLASWMRNTYEYRLDTIARLSQWERDDQYTEQALWWQNNGKHFAFLRLPAELRVQICLQTIGPIVVVDTKAKSSRYPRALLGHGQRYGPESRKGARRDPDIESPNTAIMRVCKEIRDEATAAAYKFTTKRFSTLRWDPHLQSTQARGGQYLDSLLRGLNKASLASYQPFLRSVQLEMTCAEWFRFARLKRIDGLHNSLTAPALNQIKPSLHILALSRFTRLASLDLRFVSPKNLMAECPWSPSHETHAKNHSCQKIWIDWFFLLAWGQLMRLGNSETGLTFSLSGCIKDSTRDYWTPQLNDRNADHAAVMEKRAKVIEQTRGHVGPISCECSISCYFSGPELFCLTDYEARRIEGLEEELDEEYWDFRD